MNQRFDRIGAQLLMMIGLGHSASVFYFFRPLIPTEAQGLEREAFYGWIASGIMVFAMGLLNWLRQSCGDSDRRILQACALLNTMVAVMASILAIFGASFLLPARILLVVLVFYELWASWLTLRSS